MCWAAIQCSLEAQCFNKETFDADDDVVAIWRCRLCSHGYVANALLSNLFYYSKNKDADGRQWHSDWVYDTQEENHYVKLAYMLVPMTERPTAIMIALIRTK